MTKLERFELHNRNTHLPLRERVRRLLSTQKRSAMFASMSGSDRKEWERRVRVAAHLSSNSGNYTERMLSDPTARNLAGASALAASAERATAACDFWLEDCEPSDTEVDRLITEYKEDSNA